MDVLLLVTKNVSLLWSFIVLFMFFYQAVAPLEQKEKAFIK